MSRNIYVGGTQDPGKTKQKVLSMPSAGLYSYEHPEHGLVVLKTCGMEEIRLHRFLEQEVPFDIVPLVGDGVCWIRSSTMKKGKDGKPKEHVGRLRLAKMTFYRNPGRRRNAPPVDRAELADAIVRVTEAIDSYTGPELHDKYDMDWAKKHNILYTSDGRPQFHDFDKNVGGRAG